MDLFRDSVKHHLARHEPGEQTRLADELGIPPGTLSKFIGGKTLPAKYREPLKDAVMAF